MSGDRLAELIYISTSHHDPFVRCACAARSLELRELPVTAAAVARQAKLDDRPLAGDVVDLLAEREPLRVQTRTGRSKTASAPHAARRSVMAAVQEGLLDLGPWGSTGQLPATDGRRCPQAAQAGRGVASTP